MMKNLIVMMIVLIILGVCHAQKTYSIASIKSDITISSSSCDVSVVETYDYDFTGSYSTVARAIPYSIASSIDLSSVRVDVLTGGYSLSSKYVSAQQDSNFIVANFYPSTPNLFTTRITLRYTYSASGTIRADSNKNNYVTYYYKESAPITSLTSTFNFATDVSLSANATTSGGSAVFKGRSAVFTAGPITSNVAYQPTVTFNTVGDQFSKCTAGLPLFAIVIIVIVIAICICCSIICGIITAFRNCVMDVLGIRRATGYGYVGESTAFVSGGSSGGRGGFTGTSGFAN